MLPFEQGFELQTKRELDGLTRRACRRDDDDPSSRWFSSEKGLGIWRKEVIARDTHYVEYRSGMADTVPLSTVERGIMGGGGYQCL